MDEGYIKFNCNWIEAPPVPWELLKDIDTWRNIMVEYGLVGMYDNGIGFGNLSIRYQSESFVITGSATGGHAKLNEGHYVEVREYDLQQNSLTCYGPIKASSESLSHAVIYECSPEIQAVIHVHHMELWKKLLHRIPTTRTDIAYGTPEMANEIKRLFDETDLKSGKLLVMGGHTEGIISFGKTPEEAGKILLGELKQ